MYSDSRLLTFADAVVDRPFPSARGAIQAEVMSKRPPPRAKCPVQTTSVGTLKMHLATAQNYITKLGNDGKYHLMIAVSENHLLGASRPFL